MAMTMAVRALRLRAAAGDAALFRALGLPAAARSALGNRASACLLRGCGTGTQERAAGIRPKQVIPVSLPALGSTRWDPKRASNSLPAPTHSHSGGGWTWGPWGSSWV